VYLLPGALIHRTALVLVLALLKELVEFSDDCDSFDRRGGTSFSRNLMCTVPFSVEVEVLLRVMRPLYYTRKIQLVLYIQKGICFCAPMSYSRRVKGGPYIMWRCMKSPVTL
jgi:hypothetical protein